jgi:hypothetical protein
MKTVDSMFRHIDSLQELAGKAKEIQYLNQIFSCILPSDLAKHCRLAKVDVEENILLVVVDSSVWATRIRYAAPDILKNLKTQPEFKSIKYIECLVVPNEEATVRLISKEKLSPSSEKIWRETLSSLREKKNIS